jgi:anaerobic magnesium-protoporphyrin IX monomethyl ester cyclase
VEKTNLILLVTTTLPEKSPWGMAGKLAPLGLAYIAAALEKSGFQVEIYDNYLLGQPIEEVKVEIRKRQPEIVGITCSSLTYSRCVEMAKAVKEAYHSCIVVVGGPHASYMPETLLQHSEVDYVVVGEGESAMVQLAASIKRGDPKNVVATVPGVACKIDGETIKTQTQFINDLDTIPPPARHLLPMKMYDRVLPYIDAKPIDTMSILRGCPYQCFYCETRELWGTSCRAFSPQRVVDEIKNMVENYGTKGIYFVGDNFTINKNRTQELCRRITQNKLDLKWTCETRADLINKEVLSEMKSAGCQTIFFGVESGSERIQQKLNKNINLQEVKRAFDLTRKVGIRTATSFMLGIPGENLEDMHATLNYAKSLNADICMFNIYIACPGSKLYDEVISQHLYDQIDDYLARVKTKDFDHDMLVKIQRDFQRICQKPMAYRLIRLIKQEGIGSAVKKGVKLIFH